MKRKTAIILATIGLFVTMGACLGIAYWERQLNWTVSASAQFEVYQDENLTVPLPSGSDVNIGDPGSTPYSETYWIKNIGNVDLNLTAAISFSGTSIADYSWHPGHSVIIPQDGSAYITLTLENFTVGSGSCMITLQSEAA